MKRIVSLALAIISLATSISIGTAGAQSLPRISLDGPAPEVNSQSCFQNPSQARCQGAAPSGHIFTFADVNNIAQVPRTDSVPAAAAQPDEPLPSIDLQIRFDYNSATLRDDQLPQLQALLGDLRQIDFSRARLVLMGHTDNVGSRPFNLDLSQRRADSVAAFLSAAAGIPRNRVSAVGVAFDYLLYPHDPGNAENRRVQILLLE